MTTNIKPIDTHYNGYKFRSRLEARWAIFFDELHINYAYEPEGFDLDNVWYLPDFHLLNGLTLFTGKQENVNLTNLWVEIKPTQALEDDERQKIARFLQQTDNAILLITGEPDPNAYIRFITHRSGTGWSLYEVRWFEFPDNKIGLIPVSQLSDSQLLSQTNTPRLRHALDKARQERFSTQPIQTATKICQDCGKTFTPIHHYHLYCLDCYRKQQQSQEEPRASTPALSGQLLTLATSLQKSRKRPFSRSSKSNKTISLKKRLLFGCIFPVIIFAFTTAVVIWLISDIETNGFFGSSATPTPTPLPTMTLTPTMDLEDSSFVCNCTSNSYDCGDFNTQLEAQACYDFCLANAGDIHYLDSNEDGLACESLP